MFNQCLLRSHWNYLQFWPGARASSNGRPVKLNSSSCTAALWMPRRVARPSISPDKFKLCAFVTEGEPTSTKQHLLWFSPLALHNSTLYCQMPSPQKYQFAFWCHLPASPWYSRWPGYAWWPWWTGLCGEDRLLLRVSPALNAKVQQSKAKRQGHYYSY